MGLQKEIDAAYRAFACDKGVDGEQVGCLWPVSIVILQPYEPCEEE